MSQKYDEYLEKHRLAVKKLISGLLLIFQNWQLMIGNSALV